MVGTIIGVGLFSIPFVVSRSGLIPLLVLLPVLAVVQYFFHKFYAEIVMADGERHRLPGYVAKYFGEKRKNLVLIVVLFAVYGSLLAYIIVGGIFAHQLLSPAWGGSVFFYTTALFLIQAIIVLFGLKLIARVEFYLTIFLLLTISLIFGESLNHFNPSNFSAVSWGLFFLPYGPIFFSVGGDAAIPEVCRLLAPDKKRVKKAIAWGTFVPAAVTLMFVVAVVGVTGTNTTPDALSGLSGIFSNGLIGLVLVIGLLAVITSFIAVAQATKEVFYWDLKIDKRISWVLALLPGYLLYLAGAENLTKVVSFTGAITGGLLGIILIWLFFRMKNGSAKGNLMETKLSRGMAIFLSLLFVAGFIYSFLEIL